ncbi:MAG: LptF/LptG family permease [Planctomycetaceae bacterium]|nr:LptF/LptG family permease [Planctomycetaceae bacterium]
MTIIDRYLVALFVKVVVITFISLAGVYVVADGFGNLDEFISYGKKSDDGMVWIFASYYGPRVLLFFDKTAGIIAMLAVIFAIGMLQRSNELLAIMAAGISPARVLLPLLISAGVVSGLGVANRELGLPSVRAGLASNAQDWLGEASRKCTPRYDIRNDILIVGKSTRAKNREIESPQFRLPLEMSAWGRQISAASAFQQPADANHPAGYLLKGVKQPTNLAQLPSLKQDGAVVLYSPADTPWLKPDECFVVSVVSFEQLTVGGAWRQYLSTRELIIGLQNRSIEPGADVRVTLHSRLIQPLIDISLVLLGLPLVLRRNSRNIFLAAGLCLVLVCVVYLVVLTCHGLGSNYLLDPLVATAIPLVLFGPLAYTLARPLWD